MKSFKSSIAFEYAGYCFIGLIVLDLIGFWPSYFSHFLDGTADFNFYFHFHAALASMWLLMLIAQPILILKKRFTLHRWIGRLSYVLMPLFFLSVILLAHNRITGDEADLGEKLWIPFKDLLVIGPMFIIAIWNRHNLDVHARAMIVAGLAMIEPALARVVGNHLLSGADFFPFGYLLTIGTVYLILVGMIIRERYHPKGRWVFPLGLFILMSVHCVILFDLIPPFWQTFAKWFSALPLT